MQEKIEVIRADATDQYIVENNFSALGGTFFDRYVCFSGYFGKHGPHVFAAGPVLYEALGLVLDALKMEDPRAWVETIAQAEDALKLARGQS